MEDPLIIYEIFNRIEGVAWWAVAIALPFLVPHSTARQKLSIFAASFGFFLFGISDFIEAPFRGQLPWWLWVYKIACAAFILGCRFHYVGWRRFRLRDRYFLFGVFCLTATFGVIVLQHYLYGT